MPYALDKIGIIAANKVSSELLQTSGKVANATLIPKEALFFRKGLVVRTGVGNTGTLLVEGVHYNLVLPSTTLIAYWGKPIYGGILLLTDLYSSVYATYQTVGGEYSLNNRTPNIDLLSPAECYRKTWEMVINTPEPAKADLTLHRDTVVSMQTLLTTADSTIAEIQRLGRI